MSDETGDSGERAMSDETGDSGERAMSDINRVAIISARPRKSDADICRQNGWCVGTILEGDEGYGPSRIQITAIGESGILAKKVSPTEDSETSWMLSCRDWKKWTPKEEHEVGDYWSTSRDGEFYMSNFATREEAMYEMLAQDGEKFYLGRVTDSWPIVNIRGHVDSMLEGIDCGLADHIYSDSNLIELSKEDTAELSRIIEAFLLEHATLSNRVVDVEEFEERPDSEGVDT